MAQSNFLDPSAISVVERYAKAQGFISETESLRSVTKAGEGNMNLTLRLTTDARSFILKQARPWVEKYPQIKAPAERALVETAFYELAMTRPALKRAMPALLASDGDAHVLVLEDLGEANDFTTLYAGAQLAEGELTSLVSFLVALHEPWSETRDIFANRAMRALNHEHVFRLPLDPENALALDDITPGLGESATMLQRDDEYVARVRELGELYLSDGDTLLHGDYFPGSWLSAPSGVRVIDPEFCFVGPAAFDLGVMLAHLLLSDHGDETLAAVLRQYGAAAETEALARRFAGVEIMRRLVGVAQLPLSLSMSRSIERKHALLEQSRELVLRA